MGVLTVGAACALTDGDELLCEGNPSNRLARELQSDPECVAARRKHVEDVCSTLDRKFINPDILQDPTCTAVLNHKKQAAQADEKRRLAAIGKLNISEADKQTLRERKVFIGATSEMVRLSWGPPQKINRTFMTDSTHEQWVYPSGSYLYIDNGILSAAQIPGQ
ncbi:MAG TPA: hypothetical protein VLV50_08805 [Stellaceae bacterium]|nr:hypothetical protein [Stellaceae bacterium]